MRVKHLRAGMTLVELVVTLAILGLAAGIAGVAFWSAQPAVEAGEVEALLSAARRQAVRDRTTVTVTLRIDGRLFDATAFPDGFVIYEGPDVPEPNTLACNDAQ